MKNMIIRSLACMVVALFAAACVQDKGNYEYQSRDEVFPVKIAQLPGDDILVAQGAMLQVAADEYVTGDEAGGYIYEWYILDAGKKRVVSTSTENPDLNIPMEGFRTGSYTFYLEVRSAEGGYFARSSGVPVTVDSGSAFGEGWYVAKNTGDGHANIDYASTQTMVDGETDPETGLPKGLVRNNIIPSLDLPVGNAFRIGYLPLYWADLPELDPDTGEPTGKSLNWDFSLGTITPPPPFNNFRSRLGGFMLFTDSDIWSFDALDMTPLKTKWEDIFYIPDDTQHRVDEVRFYNTDKNMAANHPDVPMGTVSEVHAILGGKLYSSRHLLLAEGGGRFFSPRMGVNNTPYDLAPFMASSSSGAQMVFDKTSKSFYYSVTSTHTLTDWIYPVAKGESAGYAQPANMPDLHNMDQDLVWMVDFNRRVNCLVMALTKSTSAEEYTLFVSGVTTNNASTAGLNSALQIPDTYPFERKVTVPAGSKLLDSKVRFAMEFNNTVYFSTGNNEIWWFRTPETIDSGEREELLFTLPAGESIVRTKVVQDRNCAQSGHYYNYVAVLSNDASGNWHIRTFPLAKTAGTFLPIEELQALNSTPAYHATGTGPAADMVYRGIGYATFN